MSRSPEVTVNPAVRFGRPTIKRISTEMLADLYWLGEDVEDEYGLTRHELLVALWFEATHGQPRHRRRWKAWGAQVGELLWHSREVVPEDVPLPPDKGG